MTFKRPKDTRAILATALAVSACAALFTHQVPTRADPTSFAARLGPAGGVVATSKLRSPRSVKLGRTRVSHQRALVLLAHSSTRVKLFLNARTLEPIAVEFRGRRYRGWSFVLAIRLARPYARGPPRV